MIGYLTPTLEFSPDPLSDATPAWVDVTDRLLSANWGDGKNGDLGDPESGRATFLLSNHDRAFEPEYEAGTFWPNIVPLRRFRLTLADGTTTAQQGVFYAVAYDIGFPSGLQYSEVAVSCMDGFGLLSLDELGLLDPPEATSYADVVSFDRPLGYWRLGDLASATAAAAVAGSEGVYKSRTLLTIGTAGGIVGDTDAAATFSTSGTAEGHVEIPLDATENTLDGDYLSVECWVKTTATDVAMVSGPDSGAGNIWSLTIGAVGAIASDTLAWNVETAPATIQATQVSTTANDGSWHHVVGTWRAGTARLYLDGAEVGSASGTPPLLAAAASPKVRIGSLRPADNIGMTGELDEVAVYETELPASRVLAHYQAGAERGFPAQLAGERIAALVDSPLWSTAKIQVGHHEVSPVVEHGQSPLEELRAAVRAEMPASLCWFDGDGDPVYLGWNHKEWPPFNTPQVIFGDAGGAEVPYEAIQLVYDDDLFNDVTTGRDGGVAQRQTDTASIAEFYRRAHAETGLLHTTDGECHEVAGAILAAFAWPQFRVESLTLSGLDSSARTQILIRDIGDLVRVKRRGTGGTPIDVVATIIGKQKSLDLVSGHLTCTFHLSRGFNAATDVWRAGIVGWSEADSTTIAGAP